MQEFSDMKFSPQIRPKSAKPLSSNRYAKKALKLIPKKLKRILSAGIY